MARWGGTTRYGVTLLAGRPLWSSAPCAIHGSMDFETLHNMVANAARNAERMCSQEGGSGNGLPFQNYVGYPFYIDEYNRLWRSQPRPTRR